MFKMGDEIAPIPYRSFQRLYANYDGDESWSLELRNRFRASCPVYGIDFEALPKRQRTESIQSEVDHPPLENRRDQSTTFSDELPMAGSEPPSPPQPLDGPLDVQEPSLMLLPEQSTATPDQNSLCGQKLEIHNLADRA